MRGRQKDKTIQHTASMVAPLCDPRLFSVQGLWRVGTGPHQGEICSTFCWFSRNVLFAQWSFETSFLALALSISRMEGAFMMAAWAADNDVEVVSMTPCAGSIRAPRMAFAQLDGRQPLPIQDLHSVSREESRILAARTQLWYVL